MSAMKSLDFFDLKNGSFKSSDYIKLTPICIDGIYTLLGKNCTHFILSMTLSNYVLCWPILAHRYLN